MVGTNNISNYGSFFTVQPSQSSGKVIFNRSQSFLKFAMQIFFLVLVVSIAEFRKSGYFVDDNILDEVFDNSEYDKNDDGIKVSDVDYDYYYEDEDQSTIPGKAGRDYPIYLDVPNTAFNCKGDTSISF